MTRFLLDTNCVSEMVRVRPDPHALTWMQANEPLLHLSVLTLGEIRKGVTLLPAGRRRVELENWLSVQLPARFRVRILPIDADIAETWGAMAGDAQRNGIAIPIIDGLIAATAQHHGFSIATRNVRDFRMWAIPVVNPWESI